jgi:hypothetical protein
MGPARTYGGPCRASRSQICEPRSALRSRSQTRRTLQFVEVGHTYFIAMAPRHRVSSLDLGLLQSRAALFLYRMMSDTILAYLVSLGMIGAGVVWIIAGTIWTASNLYIAICILALSNVRFGNTLICFHRLAACWSSSQMSLAQFGHAQMRTNFPVRRSRTQARKDTGTLQSSHTGGDCSCLSFIRSKPVAIGVRLCWFFRPR